MHCARDSIEGKPRTCAQDDEERNSGTQRDQPSYLAALFPPEEMAGFNAGDEHEQQQSQLVDEVHDRSVLMHEGRQGGQP